MAKTNVARSQSSLFLAQQYARGDAGFAPASVESFGRIVRHGCFINAKGSVVKARTEMRLPLQRNKTGTIQCKATLDLTPALSSEEQRCSKAKEIKRVGFWFFGNGGRVL